MDPDAPQIPNLASILQTLSAYAPPRPAGPAKPSEPEDGEYDPSQYDPTQPVRENAPQPALHEWSTTRTTSTKLPRPVAKATAAPSASGITSWPKALNYTVQHIFSNPQKKQRIQHLIQDQHSHERQWWDSREELIRKAQGREKSRMQLNSVLASVGGLVATTSHLQGQAEGDENSKELAVFDRKVHRACRAMVDASNKALSELQVPFFSAGDSEKIEKKDLEALRRKMLQLLEDYCGYQDEEG